MANQNSTNVGLFVPTTNVYDLAELYKLDVNSNEFKEFIVILYQNINKISIALNLKDSGYYNTSQFVNGQMFFPNPANTSATQTYAAFRQVLRTVVNFGALPNTGTKSVPHHIPVTAAYTFTRIYGAASDTTGLNYIPLPYGSVAGNDVELDVDATNVTIVTGDNKSNFNVTYVILEYITS